MTTANFDIILNLVYNKLMHKPNHRYPISPAERLAIALRFLSAPCSEQSLAVTYRMHKSTLSKILRETLPAIWDALSAIVLKRPTSEDWEQIRKGFEIKWNFPNAIGAIDGKHIEIQCPRNEGSEYYNYLKYHSIVLSGVVDSDYKFILVDIKGQGRHSDGGILKNSVIGKRLEEGSLDIPRSNSSLPSLCFVGDEAFPLKTYLMRPFPGRNLNFKKRIFNYRLSRARRVIENAFGILVARWRVLLGPINGDLKLCTDIVKASVFLHNFLRNDVSYCPPGYGDIETEGIHHSGTWRQEFINIERAIRFGGNFANCRAIAIREQLADYFISPGTLPWQNNIISRI